MQWVIFDLDGTLCDLTHRLHHIKHPDGEPGKMICRPGDPNKDWKPNWDAFNAACFSDAPKWNIIWLLKTIKYSGMKIAIFSGRNKASYADTIGWLKEYAIEYDLLEMREEKDYRSDTVVKKEMFHKHFSNLDVIMVIDDRDKVVNMWREIGLTCLQVQDGDY